MKKGLSKLFPTDPTIAQAKDTGMALVLVLLILLLATKQQTFLLCAIVALVVNMSVPQAYRPLAIIWLGFSHLLGALISRILLTFIFFLVVTPVSLARRFLGKDALKLSRFKNGRDSVFSVRKHAFTADDFEKPY